MDSTPDQPARDPADEASHYAAERQDELRRRLEALGIDPAAIERAAQQGLLLQLAAERVLSDDHLYTAQQIADQAGVDVDTFLAHMTVLGRPRPTLGECPYGEEDLEAAKRIRAFRDLGFHDDQLLDQARIFRPALNHIAEAVVRLFGATAIDQAANPTELAVTAAELAEGAAPLAEPLLGYIFRIYLREAVRNLIVNEADLAAKRLPDTQRITVCFADLTGFTALGEHLDPDQIAKLTSRFGELAVEACGARVRLVKLLGDAAMLVSPDTGAIVESAIQVVQAAAAQGGDFPPVHTGISRGMAIPRSGDWYGPPVNRASRIANIATAGRIIADIPAKAASPHHDWQALGKRPLKGITEPVELFELSPASTDSS